MFTAANGLRQVGVLKSGGEVDQAAPKTMTHVAKAEMYAVRFGDEKGQAHTVMLVKAGDQWYMPPNAEQWSKDLKPIAPWLADQLSKATATSDATSREDTVNVLSAEKL
jgi:hypothetical protein